MWCQVVVVDNQLSVGACVGASCKHPLAYSPRNTVERLTQSPEMTLNAEQRRAIRSLGDSIPDSDLIIASAV
ncbi:LOW QUALITY PROTEIN: hypothetical protein ElyMa_003208100, partial [Elysia marginata]